MIDVIIVFGLALNCARSRGYTAPSFGAATALVYMLVMSAVAYLFSLDQEVMPQSWSTEGLVLRALCAGLALLALKVMLFILPTRDHRAVEKETRFPYRILGGVLALVSIMALLPLLVFFLAAVAVYAGSFSRPAWLSVLAENGGFLGSMATFAGTITGPAAYSCLGLAQQARLAKASAVLEYDERAPVLFLRAFLQARKRAKYRVVSPARFVPWHPHFFISWRGISFDEELGEPINSTLGPFVALGDPEDYLPTRGAYKVYQGDHDWKTAFSAFLKRAGVVLVMEGVSVGLLWELREVVANLSPHQVLICIPPRRFRSDSKQWQRFCLYVLAELGIECSVVDPTPGAIVGFDDSWTPRLVSQDLGRGEDFALVLGQHFSTKTVEHLRRSDD